MLNPEDTSFQYEILRADTESIDKGLYSPEFRDKLVKYSHTHNTMARRIGKVASAVYALDGPIEAIRYAKITAAQLEVNPKCHFSIYCGLGDQSNPIIRRQLFLSAGLTEEGAAPQIPFDWSGKPLFDLVDLGSHDAHSELSRDIRVCNGDELKYATRAAIKVYKSGMNVPFELITNTAKRARDYVLTSVPNEEAEPYADDASDFQRAISALTSGLAPRGSTQEREYSQTDIALRYLAEELLNSGDTEKADQLQGLMLSRHYTAELNSVRVSMGLDPDSKYAESVMDYLNIYGADQQSHVGDMMNNLVVGGYQPAIDAYRDLLTSNDLRLEAENVDLSALVALYKSGEQNIPEILMQLYPFAGSKQWEYPDALRAIGESSLARKLLISRFDDSRTFENGLELLADDFDFQVYSEMRTLLPKPIFGANTPSYEDVFDGKLRALTLFAAFVRDTQH